MKAIEVIPCIQILNLYAVISLLIFIIIFMSIGKGITASFIDCRAFENNSLNNADDNKYSNSEIASDRDDLINLNKDLIKTLMEQLDSKDRLLEKKDKQITELHKLIENSQILLK